MAHTIRNFDDYTAMRRMACEAAGFTTATSVVDYFARTVPVTIPAKWSNCKIFGGTKRGPRDVRVPLARYWPGGELPRGMVMAQPAADHSALVEGSAEWAAAHDLVRFTDHHGETHWTDRRMASAAMAKRDQDAADAAHFAAKRDAEKAEAEARERVWKREVEERNAQYAYDCQRAEYEAWREAKLQGRDLHAERAALQARIAARTPRRRRRYWSRYSGNKLAAD